MIALCGLLVAAGVLYAKSSGSPKPTPAATAGMDKGPDKAAPIPLEGVTADETSREGAFLPWFSLERSLLLAAVLTNCFLLVAIGWWFLRARSRESAVTTLSKALEGISKQLGSIEDVLRGLQAPSGGSSKPKAATRSPAAAFGSPSKGEAPLGPAPSSRPGLQTAAPPPPPPPTVWPTLAAAVAPPREGARSAAEQLATLYCQDGRGDIPRLIASVEHHKLEWGSPSSSPEQRHDMSSPTPENQLLAILDAAASRWYVVAGGDAFVAESDWRDLFAAKQTFPGKQRVRSLRPAIIDARSGAVEERGLIEVI